MKPSKTIFAAFAAAALTLCAVLICGCSAQNTAQSGKPVVYASFYAMYDFAREIGGDMTETVNMLPQGSEPHDYEPSARDIADVCTGDVLVYCGSGIDGYIEDIAAEAEKSGVTIVKTCTGIDINGDDPHIWLDPQNAILQMSAISDALCAADPNNSDYYAARLEEAREKARELEGMCEKLKAAAQGKSIVVSHGAFGYLCSAIGATQTAIEGIQGEGDPSAAKMAELADYIKNNNIQYIFSQEGESSKVTDALCSETGAQPLTLATLEYDTGDYFEVMTKNLENIALAVGAQL